MGIRRRLGRLEAAREAAKPYQVPPATLLYLRYADDARREMEGRESVPMTREEQELERESERDALENLIPTVRGDLGWRGEEAQAFLDEWERDAVRKLVEQGDI